MALWRAALRLERRSAGARWPPPLLFFTDPDRTPKPEVAIARLPRGAGVVFRAFGAANAEGKGRRLARLARRRHLFFSVGADAALASRLRADGLHLPQRMAGRAGEIGRLRCRFLVTSAAHDLPSALVAARAGAAAVILSPIFPSASPSAGRPLGRIQLAAIARRIDAPVFALGGVSAMSARRLTGTGARGIAAIDGLYRAPPGKA